MRVSRRQFLELTAGSALGLTLYAGEVSRHEIETITETIVIPRLPDAFAGMRVVQISDFHFAEFTEAFFIKEVVRRVNALQPDMVLLTGDFISRWPLPMPVAAKMSYHCAAMLSLITCKLRYAILGNHDALVSAATVTDALETHGIPVLADSYVPLERGGQRIWLAGIKDALQLRPDLGLALPAARDRAKEPVILMAHEPDYADRVVGHDVALVLSGHTHGGQIRLPGLPPLLLPDLGKKYVHGLFRLPDGMQLYVNRGIGAVNMPFRFRCAPEITVIRIVPG